MGADLRRIDFLLIQVVVFGHVEYHSPTEKEVHGVDSVSTSEVVVCHPFGTLDADEDFDLRFVEFSRLLSLMS